MYSRCGCIRLARQVFEQMPKRSLVSWNSMIVGFALNGHAEEALEFFNLMRKEGFRPDGVSFTGALTACSHPPRREVGRCVECYSNMPMKPNEVVLGSLLAACRTHGDVGLAERLMKYLCEVDPGSDSNYVLLSNIYAAVGRWDGASKVRKKMKALGIHKKPGFSSIEMDGSIHEFVAGDKTHVETQNIYAMLDHLFLELRICGYVPEIEVGKSYEQD
ncbi:Pentatricopeptide repeat-containing protein, chloroplastic [Vitis vinifera]|uniref:Pentatricopeptide repeat-containing protein, chloroplastic n=1 Tax=Vitis vinifera TaxID=29760 RepID=A0A438HGE4_VITVI|nr:Pentatricopeptide repeat-containing protein, chloroplastic [Vitis vinifera]